ncbi:hypothetical protein GQX73_g4009 [Xylaria multiplex]|uniref:Uncharacterized protein n=1 Tax=Xylaria multiplex TaxID=323545 RepID=A0A7C8MSR3_9PEZI|nr:hypothetical protein GQX73_g4009 [Xylaria multiplex]
MQSLITSLVAILAASSIAVPISMMSRQVGSRQLGGLGGGLGSVTAPVTTVLGEVTKYLPGAKDNKPKPKTNGTQPVTKPKSSSDSLGGLGGLTGGLGVK